MTFHWPQITFVVLQVLILCISMLMHRRPRLGHYNIWVSLIVQAILVLVLYKGGFFAGVTP
jgi:cell division protein FtsW (lipid II flippase)